MQASELGLVRSGNTPQTRTHDTKPPQKTLRCFVGEKVSVCYAIGIYWRHLLVQLVVNKTVAGVVIRVRVSRASRCSPVNADYRKPRDYQQQTTKCHNQSRSIPRNFALRAKGLLKRGGTRKNLTSPPSGSKRSAGFFATFGVRRRLVCLLSYP